MGGGGSKASAAQKAVSRAAAARPPPPAAAAAEAGISAAERQREAELRQRAAAAPASAPAQQAGDNAELVRSMNRAMKGMHQYQYELYRNPEVDRQYAVRKQSKEERQEQLKGRLESRDVQALLDEYARSAQAGRPLAVAELARRYGADPEVLQLVLQHVSAPAVTKATDGHLVGRWPGERKDE